MLVRDENRREERRSFRRSDAQRRTGFTHFPQQRENPLATPTIYVIAVSAKPSVGVALRSENSTNERLSGTVKLESHGFMPSDIQR